MHGVTTHWGKCEEYDLSLPMYTCEMGELVTMVRANQQSGTDSFLGQTIIMDHAHLFNIISSGCYSCGMLPEEILSIQAIPILPGS